MAKLNDNTLVLRNGSPVSLSKGDDVPDWAKDQIGDHLLEGADESADSAASDGAPPKGGAGSGIEAWRAYADKLGVTYDDDTSREDIIAAVEANQE